MVNYKIFKRSLYDMSKIDTGPQTIPEKDALPVKYMMNSHGYRCDEFNNQKILTLGCSQTEGHGLPVELTWPYLISKKMNAEYINLAKGGDGAQGQVTKTFQFFKDFYHPEYIFAVFPLGRIEIPAIKDVFYSKNKQDKNFMFQENEITRAILHNHKLEKFSKMPHIAEDVLPEEFAIFYNILFIRMLSQYCKSNNIKFIWTYYKDTTTNILPFGDSVDGYFDFDSYLDFESFESNPALDCHTEFSDHEFFTRAADFKKFPPGHWGFHKQIHIAEVIHSMI